MSTRPVLCARCNVRVELPADPNPETIVACPVCGESDTLENVLRESGQYLAHKLFSDTLRGAISQSSALTIKEGPKINFRFNTGDESQGDSPNDKPAN
jgi:hypothetical protein